MPAEATAAPHGRATGTLYDPDVAKTERMSVEEVRRVLGQRLDKARDEGLHTVLAKHTRDTGVIVPMDWYRRAREALGDPTDL